MRIAGRSGHNPSAAGAVGIVSEVTEDRKIFLASKKYLEKTNNFVECYPGNMSGISTELMWGINKANSSGANLFYSVHLNKAYDNYNGAIGSEIWLHPVASQDTKNKANAILNNLKNLGFINRGIKYSKELAELNSTSMEAMIIECFFCEATKDIELYRKLGSDELGFAIANGIDSRVKKTVVEQNPISVKQHRNVVVYSGDVDKTIAEIMAWKLEDCIIVCKDKYKSGMGRSVYIVGAACNSNIVANVKLQGKNREETLKMAEKRVGLR